MGIPTSAGRREPGEPGVFRADLATDPASARQARAAVRQALAAWGLADPSGDAELLASEQVANAAEHGGGNPISLALRRHADPGEQPAITCEVTDTSPHLPQARRAGTDDERGRGLAIVTALATASGVRAGPAGKTAWFTLVLTDRTHQVARHIEHEPEAGA